MPEHYITLHYIFIYNHHHTVPVTQAQVRYLRQWVEGQTPPVQVTMGETTSVQVEHLCQLLREKHHHRKLVPVTSASRSGMQQQHATRVVRNLSVITAVEESDGRDSCVVRRPIEIVSNPRHNRTTVHRTPPQL